MPKPTITHAAAVVLPVTTHDWRSLVIHGNWFDTTTAVQTSPHDAATHHYDFDYRIPNDGHGHANKTVLIIWIRRKLTQQRLLADPVTGETDEVTYNVVNPAGTSADATITVVYNDDPPPSTVPSAARP
jgi:hypothetical protein